MYTSERRQTPSMDGGHSNHPSPTQVHTHAAYAPTSLERQGRNRSASYNGLPQSPTHYRSMPPSPTNTRLPPPPSPSTRDRPPSSYYDPTADSRASHAHYRDPHVNSAPYQPRSPMQVRLHASLWKQMLDHEIMNSLTTHTQSRAN